MKHSALSSLSVLSLFIGTLALAGCGAAISSDTRSSTSTTGSSSSGTAPQSVSGPAVGGFVYGGHTPIQGAHVYLLQPGTTGYGSQATSLLGNNGATSANGYALTADVSDPNVPLGSNYVTTDSNGQFSLTGAYNCTPNQPVYIYAYGGKIASTALNNNNIVQLLILGNCPNNGSTATDNFYSGSTALQYVYLNEVSTVAAAYVFQPFTLATNNSAWRVGTSNTSQGLLGIANAANTAAQLYNIQGGEQISTSGDGEGHVANYETISAGAANVGNGVVPQATIDSLANILADCVDSTVATVGTQTAACTSLFKVATNDGTTATAGRPTDTGTAAINIARFPAGNNSAAAVDATYAADLFALQGSGATPYVPQLSAAPNDWTLAISYPVTAPSATYAAAANDTLGLAESLAIDNAGQIWVSAQSGNYINRFTNLGARNSLKALTYIPGYVSIDGSNNAWTGNANSTAGTSITEYNSNGVLVNNYGSGYESAYTVVTNNAGDAFFFAQTAATSPNYDMFEYGPGGSTISGSPFSIAGSADSDTAQINISAATVQNLGGGNYRYTFTFAPNGPSPTVLAVGDTVALTLTNGAAGFLGNPATGWQNLTSVTVATTPNSTTFTAVGTTRTTDATGLGGGNTTGTGVYTFPSTSGIPGGNNVAHGAIDSSGDIWITSETANAIARVSPTGVPLFNSIFTDTRPEFPAIDNTGNAWIPVQEAAGTIYKVTSSGTVTTLNSASTGATLTYPFGSAVDGNGNVWITNRCGPYNNCTYPSTASSTLVEINGGGSTPGIANQAISPPTNYVPETQYIGSTTFNKELPDPLNLAIDSSGNIWITNYTATAANSSLVEIIGAAAPVVTPLSVAAGTNSLGTKP